MYATLADLKTAILAETVRPDLVPRLGEFVTMGEKRLFHGDTPLRVREMETRGEVEFTAGIADLPDDFLQARRLTWLSTPPVNLNYRQPEDFYGRDYFGGYPFVFCIEANSIDVKPVASGTAMLSYYAEPAALVEETDGDENTTFQAWGQLYLYAALIEAYLYVRNTTKADESIQRLQVGIAGANLTAAKARYAGTQLAPRIPGACR